MRLNREPDNHHDPFAVAVTADEDDAKVAAYVNKQKARTLSKLLASAADPYGRCMGSMPFRVEREGFS